MNKYLILIVLSTSILFSQIDDIPYDWSGQYGVISNNGRIMWNQDWSVGVLLFDGTFANYPTRFGSSYSNNFRLSQNGDYYNGMHSFIDTSQIKSRIDYYRGDFSYDQLEIKTDFIDQNRAVSLNGFKRTYKGPYGQYTDPQGSNNPLQQSYRIDYASKDEDELLNVSVGYFLTDSRLNLNDPADFNHDEKIVSVGIGYSKEFIAWKYNVHVASFQQYYNMSLDSVIGYLNRFHLNQFLSRNLIKYGSIKLGIEIDDQGISLVDSTQKNRFWSTIYGGWNKNSMDVKFGTTIAKNEIIPYFNIFAHSKMNKLIKWNSFLKYNAVLKHLFLWNETDDNLFEKRITAHIDAEAPWIKFPLIINIDYFNFKHTNLINVVEDEVVDISNSMFSSSLSTQLPIFRGWKINAMYHHTFEYNYYSDGIGDRIRLGIILNENLFKDNMFAQLKLWGDGYLNHNQNLEYKGFHYGPYAIINTNLNLPDYWVINLELSAKISKMTIGWRVNNILKTAESITNQLLPNINNHYLLITNSNNFPPMNRFVTFHIIWDFEN